MSKTELIALSERHFCQDTTASEAILGRANLDQVALVRVLFRFKRARVSDNGLSVPSTRSET